MFVDFQNIFSKPPEKTPINNSEEDSGISRLRKLFRVSNKPQSANISNELNRTGRSGSQLANILDEYDHG